MSEFPKEIRDVWAYNLEEELTTISRLCERYRFVGMDTEFPGFLVKTSQQQTEDQRYQAMRSNVNLLQIIQIGITLGDSEGNLCTEPYCTWQFNFKFNIHENLYSTDAIKLLKQAEIDFDRFEQEGINMIDFAALLFASGLVLNDNIVWISFHGCYDFAYLYKLVSGQSLPDTERDFFKQLSIYFPHFYDLRYIISVYEKVGGLQAIATSMGVERYGNQHQAGSDSFVTLLSFYKYMESKFYNSPGVPINYTYELFKNKLFGFKDYDTA